MFREGFGVQASSTACRAMPSVTRANHRGRLSVLQVGCVVSALVAAPVSGLAQSRVDVAHDSGDRLISQQWPNGLKSSFTYDASGNLLRIDRVSLDGAHPWLRNGLNGRAYRRVESCGSWTDCEATAQAQGAHLATLRDETEHTWMFAIHRVWNLALPIWIGLYATGKSTDGWAWVSGDNATFRAWGAGEPSCATGGVAVGSDRAWHAGCGLARANALIERTAPPSERLPVQMPAWLPSKTEHAGIYTVPDNCWFGMMLNSPTNENAPNAAEWTFQIPVAGTYELQVEYTAAEPRPMDVYVNGSLIKAAALAVNNGSWCSRDVAWEPIGATALSAGPVVVRLQRDSYMPHVANLRWVPR